MENKTNLIDPWRLPLQYGNSPRIRKLYNDMGSLFDNISLWDFYKFFDISQATGAWLDRLGAQYNVARPIGINGTQFLLDVDSLDNPPIVLDGYYSSLTDQIFRNMLILRTRSHLEFASITTIPELLQGIFGGVENCRVEIEEGNMNFTVYAYFADPQDVKTLNTILTMNPNIIGNFPGVSYKIIPQFMNP